MEKVWADTAYRSQKNEAFLCERRIASMIHFRKPLGKPLNVARKKVNAASSKVRGKVEDGFAHQNGVMGLFVRTIGIGRS